MEISQALEWAAGRRNAVLITLRRDGRAQSSDIAFGVVDDTIKISVTHDRAKTRNILRDGRVVFHISEPSSYSYVSIDAIATVSDVAYDAATQTAQIDLANTLAADKWLLVVTDTETGLERSFRFDVMPGDAGRDGAVSVGDIGPLRASLGQVAGAPTYSAFADFDGSGAVSVGDIGPLRAHLGQSLPAGEPSATP